jgi:hypothetical protein
MSISHGDRRGAVIFRVRDHQARTRAEVIDVVRVGLVTTKADNPDERWALQAARWTSIG